MLKDSKLRDAKAKDKSSKKPDPAASLFSGKPSSQREETKTLYMIAQHNMKAFKVSSFLPKITNPKKFFDSAEDEEFVSRDSRLATLNKLKKKIKKEKANRFNM